MRNPIKRKKWRLEYYKKNSQKIRESEFKLKKMVFDFYGNKCACCGETNPLFLTIDHVNNDGYKDRKSGRVLYVIIKKENFPNIYQILCYNCNCGKYRNHGICPHQL